MKTNRHWTKISALCLLSSGLCLAQQYLVSTAPVMELPPEEVIPLVYAQPLTNCWLESSTNLTDWFWWDFEILTNGDWRTQRWWPTQCYRVAGEPIALNSQRKN